MLLCKRSLTHSGRKKRLLHNTDTRAGTNPAGVVASGDAKPQPPSFSAGLFLAWTPCETLPDFVPPLCPLFRVSEISRYIPEARTISSVFCASFAPWLSILLGRHRCRNALPFLGPQKIMFSLGPLSVQGSIFRHSLGLRIIDHIQITVF